MGAGKAMKSPQPPGLLSQHYCSPSIPECSRLGFLKLECAYKSGHPRDLVKNVDSDSGGLRRGLRFCVENKLTGAADLGITLSESSSYREEFPLNQRSETGQRERGL